MPRGGSPGNKPLDEGRLPLRIDGPSISWRVAIYNMKLFTQISLNPRKIVVSPNHIYKWIYNLTIQLFINFRLPYLRFHLQISTFRTKQDRCIPISEHVLFVPHPLLMKHVPPLSFIFPAQNLHLLRGFSSHVRHRIVPVGIVSGSIARHVQASSSYLFQCSPLMFLIRRHDLRAALMHHQSHLPTQQGTPDSNN